MHTDQSETLLDNSPDLANNSVIVHALCTYGFSNIPGFIRDWLSAWNLCLHSLHLENLQRDKYQSLPILCGNCHRIYCKAIVWERFGDRFLCEFHHVSGNADHSHCGGADWWWGALQEIYDQSDNAPAIQPQWNFATSPSLYYLFSSL